MREDFKISIGIDPTDGKWKAQIVFPDGSARHTQDGYDTREELEQEIRLWLDANNIKAFRMN